MFTAYEAQRCSSCDIVKLNSDVLHAVARVAHCRASQRGDGVMIGAEFFTLVLPHTRGVFLSVSG